MNTNLEILSQGEEVVTGQVLDTNAAWLAQQSVDLGFTLTRHTTVGDKLNDLVLLLTEIANRADCCICTGGLGPTCDDLTTEAVSLAFNLPLVLDELALEQMQQFFARRNKIMPENNRKQALLPQGAIRIDNDWGTAVGFSLKVKGCLLIFLPGVPTEMRNMFLASVQALLTQNFNLKPSQLISIKTIGLGESAIAELLNGITIPAQVNLGFRATTDEVQTKLLFPPDYDKTAIYDLTKQISAVLGDYVFAIDGLDEKAGDLISVINSLMLEKRYSLAVIETASHGLLAAKCCPAPWLLSSSYQQTNNLLATDIVATAKLLALNLTADLILIQLYTGDLHDKTITLHSLLLANNQWQHTEHTLAGLVQRKQNQAALLSLDLLRRYLQFNN